ncbi:MAG: MFS transporter [Haloplanus sp.]
MSGWRGVGAVTGWQVSASTCFYAVFAATAALRSTFGLSRAVVGFTVTAVVLGYTVGLLPAGALVDAHGDRSVMCYGLALLSVGTLAVAVAPGFPFLLGGLLVVGLCYATSVPATNRAVVRAAPTNRHGLAVNAKQVGVSAGSGLGALLVTGAAVVSLGWRAGFAVGLLVAAAYAVRVREGDTGDGPTRPDLGGLADLPGYRTLVVAGLFLGAAIFTTTGYVVLHMTEAVGATAGLAGVTLAAVQVAGSAGRLGGGALADRLPFGDARAAALVLLCQAGLAVLAAGAVAVVRSPWVAAACLVGLGVALVGFPGLYFACMTALVPEERVGAATATGQVVMNVGGLAAPPLFGSVVDAVSYRAAWGTLAAVTAVAAALVVRLVREL